MDVPLLEREHEELLRAERALLDDLVEVAGRADAEGPQHDNASVLRKALDEPFLLVVVGEVKAGKSTFINALLGRPVCAEGPTPLTDRIHVLKHGQPEQERLLEEFLVEHQLDIELLRELCIVDTPGTNSILHQHSEITHRFIPRSDLVLFLTSIDRPYSASEDRFLSEISDLWRKKVVFLLTKVDGRPEADVQEVLQYVRRSCIEHHGFEPRVLPVSAHLARQGQDGGMEAVRTLVRETLTGGEKLRLKLESPLRSSLAVVEALEQVVEQSTSTLRDDFQAVQELDRRVDQASSDLGERTHRYLTRIHDLFQACELRGTQYFDQHVRLRRVGMLRSAGAIRESFESEVVGDLRERFAELVGEATDWLIREEISLYEQATQFLHEKVKPRARDRALAPKDPARFEYRREQIFGSVLERYQSELKAFDAEEEARRLMESAHRGLTRQLGISAVAVAVGAGSVGLLATPVGQAIGLAVAVGVGLSGFAILPAVRRHAARRFSERIDKVTAEVRRAFLQTFQEEISGARDRLRRAWEPFLGFFRAETQEQEELGQRLGTLRRDVAALEQKIAAAASAAPGPEPSAGPSTTAS